MTSTLEHDEVLAALRWLLERKTLVMRYYSDVFEADVATAMGISSGTAKSHASSGMAALRTSLERSA